MGIQTSYNRIGLQYAATNDVLMYDVLRGEWGYEGSIIDDAMSYTPYYGVTEDMIMAGTNIFCLDADRAARIIEAVESADDGALLRKLQESNKYIFNALLQSSIGGSIDSSYTYNDTLMWWQVLIIVVDITVGLLVLACAVMYVVSGYILPRKNKDKEAA